jgi:hypothetical protein
MLGLPKISSGARASHGVENIDAAFRKLEGALTLLSASVREQWLSELATAWRPLDTGHDYNKQSSIDLLRRLSELRRKLQ